MRPAWQPSTAGRRSRARSARATCVAAPLPYLKTQSRICVSVNPTTPILRVGLAGLGTVGASVWRRLASQKDLLQQRIGTEIRVDQVADRRVDWAREIGVPESLIKSDWRDLVAN